jgi:hypothetical protein
MAGKSLIAVWSVWSAREIELRQRYQAASLQVFGEGSISLSIVLSALTRRAAPESCPKRHGGRVELL